MKITRSAIVDRIETMSDFAKEIFQQLINTNNDVTIQFIAASLRSLVAKSLKTHPLFLPEYIIRNQEDRKNKILIKALDTFELQELMDMVEAESNKNRNSLTVRIPFIRNFALKTMGLLLGLDGNQMILMRDKNNAEYMEIGDIIVLAALYRELSILEKVEDGTIVVI
jgi:hypothetical protein